MVQVGDEASGLHPWCKISSFVKPDAAFEQRLKGPQLLQVVFDLLKAAKAICKTPTSDRKKGNGFNPAHESSGSFGEDPTSTGSADLPPEIRPPLPEVPCAITEVRSVRSCLRTRESSSEGRTPMLGKHTVVGVGVNTPWNLRRLRMS